MVLGFGLGREGGEVTNRFYFRLLLKLSAFERADVFLALNLV